MTDRYTYHWIVGVINGERVVVQWVWDTYTETWIDTPGSII